MALRTLFIDFDSFFAAVEQQYRPELRGRPVAVVPSAGVDTTCCIAASYEAKAMGVKTTTPVREARLRCPDITFVPANHSRYVETHAQIKAVIENCLHIEEVLSIDEMYGLLPRHWAAPEAARARAAAIKQALRDAIGPYISCSIGIAPNRFLAKVASKMEKPDGLTLLDSEDLPQALYGLELRDLHGIGKRMHRRLQAKRVLSVEALCACTRQELRTIWGSVEGERFWYALRGYEFAAQATTRRTIGHSHVLPPKLRTDSGACSVLQQMLQKACRRLRAMDHFAAEMTVAVKFGWEQRWKETLQCFPSQDGIAFAKLLNEVWAQRPRGAEAPTRVAVTLSKLSSTGNTTASLFEEDNASRRVELQRAMDRVNQRYGGRTVRSAAALAASRESGAAPMRIAFNHIPDLELEGD